MSAASRQEFSNLLVVMTDRHIGNLLVSLYAIQAAQQKLTANQALTCVIDYHFLPLANYFMPEIEFIPFNVRGGKTSLWKKIKLFFKMIIRLRQLKIDAAVDLYGHGESLKIAQLSGAKFISAFYRRPKLKKKYNWCDKDSPLSVKHQVDFYLHPFYPFFGQLEPVRLTAPRIVDIDLKVKKKLKELGVSDAKPLIIIHPGAGKNYKLWPSNYWQQLIAMLEKTQKQVLLIGSGNDKAEVDAILEDKSLSAINGFGKLNLIETIHLGFISELMIGNDSGPTHMLATTPSKVYSLFGPTDHILWSPLSDNSHIIRSDTICLSECSKQACAREMSCLQTLSAETVYNALVKY